MELAICAPNGGGGGWWSTMGSFTVRKRAICGKKGAAFSLFNLSFTHFNGAGHGMQIL